MLASSSAAATFGPIPLTFVKSSRCTGALTVFGFLAVGVTTVFVLEVCAGLAGAGSRVTADLAGAGLTATFGLTVAATARGLIGLTVACTSKRYPALEMVFCSASSFFTDLTSNLAVLIVASSRSELT